MNFNQSLLSIAFKILKALRRYRIMHYDEVFEKVASIFKDQSKTQTFKSNFLLALSFLYSLGLIEYHSQSDLITINNPHAN